jgi:hypothetical protein
MRAACAEVLVGRERLAPDSGYWSCQRPRRMDLPDHAGGVEVHEVGRRSLLLSKKRGRRRSVSRDCSISSEPVTARVAVVGSVNTCVTGAEPARYWVVVNPRVDGRLSSRS